MGLDWIILLYSILLLIPGVIMLKKTAIAVMALTASSLATAAMYAPEPAPTCSPANVTVPCEAKAWDLGVYALYGKPVFDADSAYVHTVDGYQEYNRDWGWGFELEGSYHFGTGNDVTVSWLHYDKSTDKTFTLPAGSFLGTVVPTDHNFESNVRLEQVNMLFGQHVDAGMNKNLHFIGGLQYVQIRTELDNKFAGYYPPEFGNRGLFGNYNINTARKFSGLGPMIGSDFSYDFGNNVSIDAGAAAALLYGTSKNYSTTTHSAVGNGGVVVISSRASHKQIVPEVEAKLGASYTHAMAEGTAKISAGYHVMNYFNALVTASNGTTDFAVHGPYFGVNWLGNT